MFILIITFLLLGVTAGVFTGLTPGIHINLLSIMLLSISPVLLIYLSPIVLCVFIIAMSITHTFLDSIPSIFLGAPDPEMILSILPGHQLLLNGMGYEAVKLTVIGSLISLILGLILVPVFVFLFPITYNLIKPFIGILLLIVVIFMIYRAGNLNKKFWTTFIFLISGTLGIIVLNFPNLNQPLFPLLSGMFGISGLLLSLLDKVVLPKQYITDQLELDPKTTTKAIIGGTFSGGLVSLLPGMGSAQAAIIAGIFLKGMGNYGYLILTGGINTVNFLLSLVTLFTLEKARNGAVIVILEIIQKITINELLLFLISALIVGGIGTLLALKISKLFATIMQKINYKMTCGCVIGFIVLLVCFFSGFVGLIVLIISTAIGVLTVKLDIGRNIAMGCLLLPIIVYFLF